MTRPRAALGLALAATILWLPGYRSATKPARRALGAPAMPRTPIGFVRLDGVPDGGPSFVAHASGGTIVLDGRGLFVTPSHGERSGFRLDFEGADAGARPFAAGDTGSRISAFIGHDPAQWREGQVAYRSVVYRDLWTGVDLQFAHTADGRLKSTFTVRPGGDSAAIRWSYSPNVRPRIVDGELQIVARSAPVLEETTAAVWRELPPIAWQILPDGRRQVSARYVVSRDGEVALRLGRHDRDRPVVIDPTYVFGTFLGGSALDGPAQLAVGSDGAIYFAAHTNGADFPVAASGPGRAEEFDLVVGRVAADGSRIDWCAYVGGSGRDLARAIALDESDNVYVTGTTTSPDFPLVDPVQSAYRGSIDGIVLKLDGSGRALDWSSYYGGSGPDTSTALGISGHEIVISGWTDSDDFPVVAARQPSLSGSTDAFVARVRLAPATVLYSSYLGGSRRDYVHDLAVDDNGAVFLVGGTDSSDFPAPNALRPIGRVPDFLCKSSDGRAFDYCTGLVGGWPYDVAVDGSGHVLVVGVIGVEGWTGTKPIQPPAGGLDAYIVQVDAATQAIEFSSPLGGSRKDLAFGVTVDEAGTVYVLGGTESTDFPTVLPLDRTLTGASDAFVARIDVNGNALLASTYLGGRGAETMTVDHHGSAVAVSRGVVLVSGLTTSQDFPTTGGAADQTFGGAEDGFLVELDFLRDPPPPTPTPPPATPENPSARPGVCRQIVGRAPPSAIADALANPDRVGGWQRTCHPNRPPSPLNGLRTMLTLRNPSVRHHPLHNPLVFRCGCP